MRRRIAMNGSTLLSQLTDSALGPFGQTCLVGVVLNAVAAAGILHLWREDKSEGYLGYLGVAHLLSTVRWLLTYPAIALPSFPLQVAAATFGGLSVSFNLIGAFYLLQP